MSWPETGIAGSESATRAVCPRPAREHGSWSDSLILFRKEKIMRYVTHQFGHAETLERARRWLVQAGIDPSRIEARPHAILNLAVAVKSGESAAVQCSGSEGLGDPWPRRRSAR